MLSSGCELFYNDIFIWSGGVGSISILLLSQLGYDVVAVSGKAESESTYLRSLGAREVIERSLFEGEARALGRETYAGCVDSCGGVVLANILPLIKYGGVVAACGLASGIKICSCQAGLEYKTTMTSGMSLVSTVAPFILRGVTLAGVESALLPLERRVEVYQRFGHMLTQEKLSLVSGDNSLIEI